MALFPSPRRVAAALLVLCTLVAPRSSPAQGTLISLPNRRDMVFDHAGHYLYITTTDGFVYPYNLSSNQLEAAINLGGSLNATDIAADDSFLLVTQGVTANGQGTLLRINLQTRTAASISYPLTDTNEQGGYDVAILNNGLAFFTTASQASVPLRQVNLATNVVSNRAVPGNFPTIGGSAQLTRSADGALLYLFEGSNVLAYDSPMDHFTLQASTVSDYYAAHAAISRDRSLLVTRHASGNGAAIDTSLDLTYVRSLRHVTAGVAFDPTRDVVYGVDSLNGQVIGYGTGNFVVLFRFDVGESVDVYPSTPQPFDTGTLVISPDGKYLALETPSGVRLFSVPVPPYPTPAPSLGAPRGIVFDHTGNFVYLTTNEGYVLKFDVATTTLQRAYDCGGWLYGIDISADDSFLLVAQAYYGLKQGAFQKLDLASGAITDISYDRALFEHGGFDVAIAANGAAFATSSGDTYSVPLHQINLTTNTSSVRHLPPGQLDLLDGGVRVERSADRSLLYFLEPNSSGGRTFTYRASTDTIGAGGDISTYFDNTHAAVNRNGTLALLRYADDARLQAAPDFHTTHVFPDLDDGVAFNATADVVYAVDSVTSEIVAYDTSTFAELSRMWFVDQLPQYQSKFELGSLVASQDGRYLALYALGGLVLIDLQNPPPPRPNYTITVTPSPAAGGTVNGAGTYAAGQQVVLTAFENSGYTFAGWLENGVLISTNNGYSFTPTSNRAIVASFVAYPTLSISATPTTVRKNGTATFTISRNNVNAASQLSVFYFMGGTAIPGSDYTLSGPVNLVFIPAGRTSAQITLRVITAKTRGKETAIMGLVNGAGYTLPVPPRRGRKNPSQATVTIQNK